MTTSELQPVENVPEIATLLRAKRALAILAVFFLVQILVSAVVGIGRGIYVAVAQDQSDASLLADAIKRAVLPASVVGMVVSAWVAFWMTRRFFTGSLRGGALAPVGWRRAATSDTAMAALAGGLLSLIYLFVLVRISPPIEGQKWGPLVMATLNGGWQRYLWAFVALVLAPPIEEFVFRGVFLEGLVNSIGIKAAAVIVTVAFVVVHASETLAYWPAWAGISLLSVTTLFFRLKSRSLVPAIGAHFGYNFVLVVIGLAGTR